VKSENVNKNKPQAVIPQGLWL